jgi:hypothetical protein
MPEIVAFDECGNTGDHLLDPAQPVYALASVHLDEGRAAALVDEVRPATISGELKYSVLRRSRVGREAVARVIESDLVQPGQARISPMHKPFAVVARLFDYAMEPTLHNGGFDIYDRGFHIAFANMLWRGGKAACGSERWETLIESFVRACREPTDENIASLCEANLLCSASATNQSIEQLLMLVPPLPEWLRPRIAADMGHGIGVRDLLDPAVTSLIENCIAWSERLGPIHVRHDESNVVARWKAKLEVLASPEAELEVGEYWAGRVPYPLAVEEIELVRSADSACVQLADILAGAAVTWLGQFVTERAADERYVEALGDAGIEQLIEGQVWPEPEDENSRF